MTSERFDVAGLVQGVGFRPFAYRLANELGLSGTVANDRSAVVIRVTGQADAIDEFARRLVAESPPLSSIETLRRSASSPALACSPEARSGFSIAPSTVSQFVTARQPAPSVPPDVAVCDRCLAELFDPADRRHRHPFITCTDCGPRFTIIRSLPYDRPNTTMAPFDLCPACRSEYHDPSSRRHHAQPISCHDCGPRLDYRAMSDSTPAIGDDPIVASAQALALGRVVAIKGIGGYHLACDATSDVAVAGLRRRKARPEKPLAVMVRTIDEAHELAELGAEEADALLGAARPIVLARARAGSPLSSLVAPGTPLIGVMLAYSPVHHLLLAEVERPLVMTSGNRGGEPIVHRDGDVTDHLGPLCDAVLANDRPIQQPCDDSVLRLVNGRPMPLRRARGYAPLSLRFPTTPEIVLAVGGDLKNTFCLASAGRSWVSQHLGDLGMVRTRSEFEAAVDHWCRNVDAAPTLIARDAHPGYRSSAFANRLASSTHHDVVVVQHHHAHIAAVMAEHELDPLDDVIGFAFDGTGFGDDATIWGGEVLRVNAMDYTRESHLRPVALPGGDAAAREPWRSGLAHLAAAGVEWTPELPPVGRLDPVELDVIRRQLETGLGCFRTSSMGRLFDAVASLLGLRQQISFEGQAAMDLEFLAEAGGDDRGYRLAPSPLGADPGPMVRRIVGDLRAEVAPADIAWSFHRALVRFVADSAADINRRLGLETVVLSGGVFQNALLVSQCREALSQRGFTVLTNSIVPPNDGGLALGQAFVAAGRALHAGPTTATRR